MCLFLIKRIYFSILWSYLLIYFSFKYSSMFSVFLSVINLLNIIYLSVIWFIILLQNHFGRPDMEAFFKFVQKKHSYVSKFSKINIHNSRNEIILTRFYLKIFILKVNSVGVFSCGPRYNWR